MFYNIKSSSNALVHLWDAPLLHLRKDNGSFDKRDLSLNHVHIYFRVQPTANMVQVSRIGFLAIAMVFHLVYIYSIFDIYFVSPIVSGMREFEVVRPKGVAAPAQRVVLIVGKCSYEQSKGSLETYLLLKFR